MPNVPHAADLKVLFVQESMLELRKHLIILQKSVLKVHEQMQLA